MNIMGETGVVSIKVMTNKFTGEPAGYGFINFDSDQTAIVVMHRLGGKIIPLFRVITFVVGGRVFRVVVGSSVASWTTSTLSIGFCEL